MLRINRCTSPFLLNVLLLLYAACTISCTSAPRYSTDRGQLRQRSRYYRTGVNPHDFPLSGEEYRTGVVYEWVSSFYGRDFHGRLTANGEEYDMYGLTCAHRELPFNTILRVTNPVSGETVTVRVNDRGPFITGRDLDLSQGAAERIGMIDRGVKTLNVEIMVLP